MSKLPEAQRAKLVRIAALARQASTDTLVHLVQRRHDVNDYSYLMIARPRPSHLVTAVFDTRLAAA